MPKFKGFDDYIEIFRGGTQVDSEGLKHDGDDVIKKAIASFNSTDHEPPLVAGHPKSDGPAYGWVESLKEKRKDGTKILLARFKEVMPEFEELVTAGRYKKRSASFYPDGSLRHVGFLGAVPPAVKGLADIEFNEGDPLTFDFHDSYGGGVVARLFGRLREFLIEEKGVEAADRIVPDWDVDTLRKEADQANAEPVAATYTEQTPEEEKVATIDKGQKTETSFTEADLKDAKDKGRKEAEDEFLKKKKKKKKEEAKEKVKAFCEKKMEDGGPLPAWLDSGLQEFMEGLDTEASFEFSEGGKQINKNSLEWFQDFMEKLPQAVDFTEHAKPGDAINTNEKAEEIAKQATEFKEAEKKAGRTISFTEAVGHITGQGK